MHGPEAGCSVHPMDKMENVGVCSKILMLQALIVGLERSWSARDEMGSSSRMSPLLWDLEMRKGRKE